MKINNFSKRKSYNIILAGISVLALISSNSWNTEAIVFSSFFAFIPILLLIENNLRSAKKLFFYLIIILFIWIFRGYFFVKQVSFLFLCLGTIFYLFTSIIPFFLYFYFRKKILLIIYA